MKNETVTQGLGLDETFTRFVKDQVDEKFSEHSRISDIVERAAEEIRLQDLGEIDSALSSYEKKLVFLGIAIGAKLAIRDFEAITEMVEGIMGKNTDSED